MCGIFCVINNGGNTYKNEKFVQDALIVSQLRGMDSTGLLQVDKKYNTFIHKQAMCASNFLDLKHTKAYLTDATTARVTLGHVRAATYGKVTTSNAHPFEFRRPDKTGYISGVHNGSLTGWTAAADSKEFEVDSQWALSKIASDGADAFEDFTGSYCFMWYDNSHDNRGKFYVARNSQRPMSFILSKDKKQAYFMSEADMLALVVGRNEIPVEDTIYTVEPGKLYVFDLEAETVTWSKSNLPVKSTTNYSSYRSDYGIDDTDPWDYSGEYGMVGGRGYETSLKYNDATGAYDYTPASDDKKDPPLGADAKRTIEKWKKALNGSAVDAVKDEDTTTAADLVSKNEDDAAPSRDTEKEYKAPDSWFSTASATRAEQTTARATEMFGELVFLEGVVYEPSTCEMFGEIQDFDYTNKKRIIYDAVTRGQSAAAASREWQNKDNGGGGWGVVIGEYEDLATRKRTFVVSGLTDKGKKAFLREMNAA